MHVFTTYVQSNENCVAYCISRYVMYTQHPLLVIYMNSYSHSSELASHAVFLEANSCLLYLVWCPNYFCEECSLRM